MLSFQVDSKISVFLWIVFQCRLLTNSQRTCGDALSDRFESFFFACTKPAPAGTWQKWCHLGCRNVNHPRLMAFIKKKAGHMVPFPIVFRSLGYHPAERTISAPLVTCVKLRRSLTLVHTKKWTATSGECNAMLDGGTKNEHLHRIS